MPGSVTQTIDTPCGIYLASRILELDKEHENPEIHGDIELYEC